MVPLASVSVGGEPDARSAREAFVRTHDGWSTDALIIDEELRNAYLKALEIDPSDPGHHDRERDALLKLLKLRKTGRLDVPTTRSDRGDTRDIADTAEIAIRTVLDRHRVSIDDVLCDPRLRNELQSEAEALLPEVAAERIRKAVLRLRKVRRLRPELVLRVADWKTRVITMPISRIDLESIPSAPGIYLFRAGEGYLYIGEAADLSVRIAQHLGGSHNTGLARRLAQSTAPPQSSDSPGLSDITLELHVFDPQSPGNRVTMRRAYESELIRSREPIYNLRP